MATDATLTKTQKNAVLVAIQNFQFDPAEFDWAEIESTEYSRGTKMLYRASQLIHKGTGYYVTFGGVFMRCSPGDRSKVEGDVHSNHWEEKMLFLADWLERLRVEVDAPDLWAAVGKERELSDAASSHLENKPFTVAEKAELVTKLAELKHYLVSGQQFQIAQAQYIDSQFTYLRESSERLGRKDWLIIAYGTLVNLAVTLALPPEKATGLLQLAGTLLKSLWHGMQVLLTG